MQVSMLTCIQCGKEFKRKLSLVRKGGGKYCSNACHYEFIRKGKVVPCASCGENVYRKPRLLRLSKSKKYFCNKSCQTRWRNQYFVGSLHTNWTTGRHSYRSVLGRIKR